MDVDVAVVDEPLPAPTGPMFLGAQPRAQQPSPATAAPQANTQPPATAAQAAGDMQTASSTPAAQMQPEVAQRAQPPHGAAAPAPAAQQTGMSRLDVETCLAMHGILAKYKEADPFRNPVDVEAFGIPDYYDVIKKPMDLKTAREKLRAGRYNSVMEWRADIQLIWDNAKKYNGENHPITLLASKLAGQMEKRWQDAVAIAKVNMTADERGDPRPRKGSKQRTTELQSLLSSQPGSSESDSMLDEPTTAGAAAAAAAAAGAGRGTRLANGSSSGAAQRSPEPGKVAVKRERDAEAAAGRPAKRRLPSGAAAVGGPNQGLELDVLAGMLNNPMARQLGAEEPDDLAFLALWKRLMVRKQQLAAAAQDSEPLRNSNQQLRASLGQAQDNIAQLQERLRDETAARQAAVAAKAAAEVQVLDLQRERDHWKSEYNSQKQIMEAQRDLLEQQQAVLRKLAAHKQAQLSGGPAKGDAPQA